MVAVSPGQHVDRRRIGLVITDAGRELLLAVTESRRLWMAERLADLTDAERAAVRVAVGALERTSAAPDEAMASKTR